MVFYLSLFIFIASLVIGLVLMISWRNLSRERFLLLTSIHSIFLVAFLASLFLKGSVASGHNYFFTIYLCSGIVLSGLAWRSKAPKVLRGYFSIFLVTIPLFLLSPSRLLNFLHTMKFTNTTGASFDLGSRFFLEEQTSTTLQDGIPVYKVVRKNGFFYKTIQRDISFGGKLDSARVLDFQSNQFIRIRGYTSTVSYVSTEIDSSDTEVTLVKKGPGSIEYRL